MKTNSITHDGTLPPDWALAPRKGLLQSAWDFVGAPLRMVLLPDSPSERLHLTSLRAERYAAVLPELRGRVLDIGAGDNALVHLYRQVQRARARMAPPRSRASASTSSTGAPTR